VTRRDSGSQENLRVNNDERRPEPQSKPRYEKPGIAWEETLDVRQTLAVACGKIAGGQGFCNAAQRS
jgi:hypothetical protein